MTNLTLTQLIGFTLWWLFVAVLGSYFISRAFSYGWHKSKSEAIKEELQKLIRRNPKNGTEKKQTQHD